MRHYDFSQKPPEGMHWKSMKLILPYLGEFRGRVALAIACLLMAKVASISGPFILKYVVDALNQPTVSEALLLPLALVAAYGTSRFSYVVFGEIRDTLFGRVTERAMRRVGLKVFEHLHALDLDFHLNRRTGGLARDIERGTNGISFLMRFFVFNIAPTMLEILVVSCLLGWRYGIVFSLMILLAASAYIVFSVVATEWRTRFVREMNLADSTANTRAVDSLLNYETVKYFGNEQFEADRYDGDLARWENARRSNRLSLFALNGGQAFIVALAMTVGLMLAAYGVSDGSMTLGDFVLINAFMMQLFMPLNFLGMVYREIKGSLAGIEQMFALLEVKPQIIDSQEARPLQIEGGKIEFRDVGFRYGPERSILDRVSFTVGEGEKVAVVGASGAGKSTLVKLLFRFYEADAGKIVIDGQDIRDCSQASLRASIGIVPQDTVLFNDTLFENIRYGRPDADQAAVAEAIRMAHLDDFISALPEGAETQVGERGLKLSGGERQRVAIARTLLKRPRILVFDEATSSLDSRSERAILVALAEIAQGHTSLVIAHRLSTVVDADRIVVLDDGVVVEQGSHEELLKKDGAYAALWQTQQRSALVQSDR